MTDNESTLIRVKKSTKARIEALGTAADTIDDVLRRLLNDHEAAKSVGKGKVSA